jgi:two-component system, NtrC family, response regulator HydG
MGSSSTGVGKARQARLLIVDDDIEMRGTLETLFSEEGHVCELVADAQAALQAVDRRVPDVIVSDVRMDGMSGLELLDRLKRMHPTVPVILMTGLGAIDDAVHAVKHGAFQYMTKPCDADKLRDAVTAALDERDNGDRPPATALNPNVELVGTGPAMRALERSIGLVAASSAPVLITGETGVGKELVARAIHMRGPRHDRPFIAVNTSAIPHDLLEAEVFGHVRGAFTGAAQGRRGLLTEADGGTLLLDEIGDMPLLLQSKLLRVLQFGEVRPVGNDRTHQVDVRVIAATHCDLPALVRAGRFREDLYYRLNVLPVLVPPLRDHPEDIPALAAHFFAAARQRTAQSSVKSLREEGLRALTEARWPGNVRELASAIERAVVFGSDEMLTDRHDSSPPSATTTTGSWPFPAHAPWSLRRLSRAYMDWVLGRTGGNKEQAAQILGINLSTLYRWERSKEDPDERDPTPSS